MTTAAIPISIIYTKNAKNECEEIANLGIQIETLVPSISQPKRQCIGFGKTAVGEPVFIKLVKKNPIVKKTYLLNERNALRFLQGHTGDTNISVPRVVSFRQTDKHDILLTTRITAQLARSLSSRKLAQSMLLAIRSLHMTKLTAADSKEFNLSKRGAIFYAAAFPYLFIKTSLNHPRYMRMFIKAFWVFYRLLPAVFRSRMVLSHRDVTPDNILASEKQYYLIDFQYAAITSEAFDYASSYRSIIGNKSVSRAFKKEMLRQLGNIPGFNDAFVCLSIYYAFMGLIDRNFPKKRTIEFLQVLQEMIHI